MPAHKQKRVAQEVLEIYAPIASRLGMFDIKGELEDLAFKYYDPKEYDWMKNIVETRVRETGVVVSQLIEELEKRLKEAGILHVEIYGRVKRLYSLYKKMKRYQNDITKIYDIIAIRVVVENVEDCYAAFGIIHRHWKPLSNRIKDYIAQPKPNGYQSLHTTIFCGEENIAELQIRTREMHELAEYGIAAHWKYKEAGGMPPKNLRWMEELVKIQKELQTKKDFLSNLKFLKLDMFEDRIFVFTPKGDVIDLPKNATPVDLAYAIHTELGNKCVSAKINNKIANLDTPLRSGDVVEIIMDKFRKGPNPDWLKSVKTHHARLKIREATKRSLKTWFKTIIKKTKTSERMKTRSKNL
jgi:GTP pyrophosphokinase